MDYPKYVKSNKTGRDGFNILAKVVEQELGWVVRRNHQEDDFGIDAYFDIAINEYITGKSIAVQIKSGDSYLKDTNNDFWNFTGERKHLNYYLNHDIPVLIVLVDTTNEVAYWEVCKVEYISLLNDTTWSMVIPKKQQINISQKEELIKHVSKTIDYVSHYEAYWSENKILSDHDYICIFAGKDDIEEKNYIPLVELINRISSNKMLLSHYKERIEIGIHGYDEDNRELYEIKETQDWISNIFIKVPGLSYFLANHKDSHFLKLFLLSIVESTVITRKRIGERYSTQYDPKELEKVFNILFADLNDFTDFYSIGEDINREITKNIAECITGQQIDIYSGN